MTVSTLESTGALTVRQGKSLWGEGGVGGVTVKMEEASHDLVHPPVHTGAVTVQQEQ